MNRISNLYNVWTDGSYQSGKDRGGIGWVIDHNGERKEKCARLPSLDKHTIPHASDYAELYAVATAFQDLPAGAAVKLRLDCQNVLDWLKNRKLTCKPKTYPILAPVFALAMSEVEKMGSVEFIKASDKNNEGMALAHQLSRKGAVMAAA